MLLVPDLISNLLWISHVRACIQSFDRPKTSICSPFHQKSHSTIQHRPTSQFFDKISSLSILKSIINTIINICIHYLVKNTMLNQQNLQSHTFSQEVSGFVKFISSLLALLIALFFAFTPNTTLIEYGITTYPNKYWFLAIPSIIIYTIIWLLGSYVLFNFRHTHTPSPHDDAFLRDNLTRRIREEDVHDAEILYQVSKELYAKDRAKMNEQNIASTITPTTTPITTTTTTSAATPMVLTTTASVKRSGNNTSASQSQQPRGVQHQQQQQQEMLYDIDPRPILESYDLPPTLITEYLMKRYTTSTTPGRGENGDNDRVGAEEDDEQHHSNTTTKRSVVKWATPHLQWLLYSWIILCIPLDITGLSTKWWICFLCELEKNWQFQCTQKSCKKPISILTHASKCCCWTLLCLTSPYEVTLLRILTKYQRLLFCPNLQSEKQLSSSE